MKALLIILLVAGAMFGVYVETQHQKELQTSLDQSRQELQDAQKELQATQQQLQLLQHQVAAAKTNNSGPASPEKGWMWKPNPLNSPAKK